MFAELWFDVGIKRYTTVDFTGKPLFKLWFDVGIKRYTTTSPKRALRPGCGLMQESKDIQRVYDVKNPRTGCGLMQESKDIQRGRSRYSKS